MKERVENFRNVRKQREIQRVAEIRRKEKRLRENPRPIAKEKNAVTDEDIQNWVKAVNESKERAQKAQGTLSNSNVTSGSSGTTQATP